VSTDLSVINAHTFFYSNDAFAIKYSMVITIHCLVGCESCYQAVHTFFFWNRGLNHGFISIKMAKIIVGSPSLTQPFLLYPGLGPAMLEQLSRASGPRVAGPRLRSS
jgi:hypothetical protein